MHESMEMRVRFKEAEPSASFAGACAESDAPRMGSTSAFAYQRDCALGGSPLPSRGDDVRRLDLGRSVLAANFVVCFAPTPCRCFARQTNGAENPNPSVHEELDQLEDLHGQRGTAAG